MYIDSIELKKCAVTMYYKSALNLSDTPNRHRIYTITETLRRTTTSTARAASAAKFVMSTALRINIIIHLSVFYICSCDVNSLRMV